MLTQFFTALLAAITAYIVIYITYRLIFTNEKDTYPVKKTRKNISPAPKNTPREAGAYEDWGW